MSWLWCVNSSTLYCISCNPRLLFYWHFDSSASKNHNGEMKVQQGYNYQYPVKTYNCSKWEGRRGRKLATFPVNIAQKLPEAEGSSSQSSRAMPLETQENSITGCILPFNWIHIKKEGTWWQALSPAHVYAHKGQTWLCIYIKKKFWISTKKQAHRLHEQEWQPNLRV